MFLIMHKSINFLKKEIYSNIAFRTKWEKSRAKLTEFATKCKK